jgi:2-polyprenyl-3-methyl-5-hydroxy-6-metoxy-1,4-benzoquinol methylase
MRIRKCENPFQIHHKSVNFETVKRDYIEFSGEQEDAVISKIENSIQDSMRNWKEIVKTNSPKEIAQFYCESDYIYEIMLAYLHPERFSKMDTTLSIIKHVKKNPGRKVMEFGGGIGQLCLMIYFNTDKDVTYVDLPSRAMNFAKWRFKKYQANIHCIEAGIDGCSLGNEVYDCIVSDAVLEHVLNLEETVKSLCASLKPKGTFCLLFDPVFNKDFPMHISARENVERIMRKNGLIRISYAVYVKTNALSAHIKHFLLHMWLPLRLFTLAIRHPKRAFNYALRKLRRAPS